ncbi:hypothetical protein PGTUg99_015176 [Puccinia graminis f. sp. tritici]|uniref:Uncharacterized protein n=1 Tax=Puccinia graminis f. sp. tritici TaxID=56615 RepID=A0A5B0RB76_PUCGR|nr:hypothetical protein PGTUg99_015176 [Puccinia graminis f. sp. tritici]
MKNRMTRWADSQTSKPFHLWICPILPCCDCPVGPARKPKIPLGDFVTCAYSRLPVGTPVNTCCDESVGDVINRSDDDPLIVWYDDYNKHGCHEIPEVSGPDI